MFLVNNYLPNPKLKSLKESGLQFRFERKPDETGYMRYKNLTINFPEGAIPLVIFMFGELIDSQAEEAIKKCIDSFFYMDNTDVANTYVLRIKDDIDPKKINKLDISNLDVVIYPFLKCIHPERILIMKGTGNDSWLSPLI